MVECGSGGMCNNLIKWFHIGCVNFKKRDLTKREFYCAECMQRRNRGDELPKGSTKVVQPPPAPWRTVPEDDALPDVQDFKEQFWSQSFRTRIRQNALLEARPLSEVTWAECPSVSACIQNHAHATEGQVRDLQDFVLKFVCSLNTRLAHKNDIFTLEALTLFDPRSKAKERNSSMRALYLEHLLTRSGVSLRSSAAIRSACVNWFQIEPADLAATTVGVRSRL
jgi:hypothetical protein